MHVRFITAGEDRLIDLLAPRPSRPESSACRTIKEGVSNRVPTGSSWSRRRATGFCPWSTKVPPL